MIILFYLILGLPGLIFIIASILTVRQSGGISINEIIDGNDDNLALGLAIMKRPF